MENLAIHVIIETLWKIDKTECQQTLVVNVNFQETI